MLASDAYGTEIDEAETGTGRRNKLRSTEDWLLPAMNAKRAANVFEGTRTKELAVLNGDRKVLGLLTKGYLLRRYADELKRVRRDLSGER